MNDTRPSPPAARGPAMLRALRHRNFRLFFFGQLLSLPGTWIQMVAQSWLIYRLTDSAALLGLAGFANQFPVFLMAPFGGAVADRFDRRRLLIGTQVASSALALLLAAIGTKYAATQGAGLAFLADESSSPTRARSTTRRRRSAPTRVTPSPPTLPRWTVTCSW